LVTPGALVGTSCEIVNASVPTGIPNENRSLAAPKTRFVAAEANASGPPSRLNDGVSTDALEPLAGWPSNPRLASWRVPSLRSAKYSWGLASDVNVGPNSAGGDSGNWVRAVTNATWSACGEIAIAVSGPSAAESRKLLLAQRVSVVRAWLR